MIDVHRIFTHVEAVFHEFGPPPMKPARRGGAVAVIENPFAGRFVADIAPFMDELKPLGVALAHRLIAALDATPNDIQGYGKAAIVGSAGEIEHGALWHVPGGYGMRETLGWRNDAASVSVRQPGNALAIVPSTKKVGAPGTAIDVPITHLNASYVRSHLDAMEIRVPGAPAADEVAYILVMSLGPRVHERLGGLRVEQIDQWDGQR
jgi:Amino acid synthesis